MRLLLRSAACAIAVLTACSKDPVGRSFASEAEVLAALGPCDLLGRFDVAFPVRIVRVVSSADALHFEHAGAEHVYPAMQDASLRAVFVEGHRGEGVLVVRSNQQT